jgi:DNA-binding MarR family transcriptional regulator
MTQRDALTPEQTRVLAHLEQIRPDARSARDVAEALGLDVLDALPALWTLSRLGYARLRPGDPDARPEVAEYEVATPSAPAPAAEGNSNDAG